MIWNDFVWIILEDKTIVSRMYIGAKIYKRTRREISVARFVKFCRSELRGWLWWWMVPSGRGTVK